MSRYFKREKTPKTKLMNLLAKLIGKHHLTFEHGSHFFYLPHTQHVVEYDEKTFIVGG